MLDARLNTNSFILFELAGTTYAIRSVHVQQLEMIEQISPVPNAAGFVEGIVLSRGQVIPVINLRARFGFERIPIDPATRLIVVTLESRVVGLMVDAAREFVTILPEAIRPPNEAIEGLSGQYLEGIAMLGERIVLVLSMNQVVTAAASVAAPGENGGSPHDQIAPGNWPGLKA